MLSSVIDGCDRAGVPRDPDMFCTACLLGTIEDLDRATRVDDHHRVGIQCGEHNPQGGQLIGAAYLMAG